MCFTSPAEGGDPSAQLRVAVRAQRVAAHEQLHRVIPVGAGRVPPAGTRQGRVQLERVKVPQGCRETRRTEVSRIQTLVVTVML